MAKTILGKIIQAIKKTNTVIETAETLLPKPKETNLRVVKKPRKKQANETK